MEEVDRGDSTDSDVEENLGILRPTVLDQMKEILREYRNDVQIIKELIQNADDAGASEMKILYQARCLNSEQEGEAKFRKFLRAPALAFFNNSVFSEDNWKGVRSIYTSEKAHDPLKIGRFGLGFKSIFHMTDFPTILSGAKIMFIDPGESDQNKICTTIHLKKLKRSKNLRVSDLTESFNDLFGFDETNLASGYFPGTLFWFPLRKRVSQLSDTIYSEDEVITLLDSFIEESDNNIIFANTVSKIEVFIERSEEKRTTKDVPGTNHSDSVLHLQRANFGKHVAVYTVQIDNASETLIKERRELHDKLIPVVRTIPELTEHWTFDVYVRCNKRISKEETKESRSRWLIVNYLKGGELTEHTQVLLKDENLGYHHLVAIAGRIKDFDNEQKHTDAGRVFCNQPLPHDNQTGLPVLINAQFALGNNRRQIKWEDKEGMIANTDKEIEWNHALISEILPYAYLVLLQEMIKLSKTFNNREQFVSSTYNLIPDIQKTEERWKQLGTAFLHLIQTENMFYTQYNDDQWIGTREAVLLSDCDKFTETISDLLKNEGLPFARIPRNIEDSLIHFTSKVQKMSPEFLKQNMVVNSTYKNMSCQQKEHLFQYLKSEITEETARDDLELIPLADGSFTCLGGTDVTFVEAKDVIKLFPGKLSKFVSTDLQSETMDIIQLIALDGSKGLNKLDAENAADSLEEVVENNFGLGKSLTIQTLEGSFWKQWLLDVWKFIQLRYKESFDVFASLPIYPIKCEPDWDTAKRVYLCSLSSLVMYFPNCDDKNEAETVSQAFELLSVNIVRNVPYFVSTDLTDVYITNDQSTKMVNLIERVSSDGIELFNANVCCEEQRALLRYISLTIHTEITPNCSNVLKKIRVFRQATSPLEIEYRCVSINENQSCFKKQHFPVEFYKPLILISNDSEISLAKKLGAEVLDLKTLTLRTLAKVERYTTQDVQSLVEWIINDTKLFNNKEIMQAIKGTKFIKSVDGHWNEPAHFFDPHDELISKLFKNEGVLPNISGKENLLNLQKLKELGMKSREDITGEDVVRVCQTVHASALKSEDDYEKAEVLLEFLNQRPTIVKKTMLCYMKIVPVQSFHNDNYPSTLELKNRSVRKKLCMPSEVKSLEYIHLIGSIHVVMDCTHMQNFAEEHGLCQPPEIEDVILHFKNVLKGYRVQREAIYAQTVLKIYEWFAKSKDLSGTCYRELLDSFQKPNDLFIWNGTDFVSPDDIYIESTEENFEDLNSVMSKLPKEFYYLKDFFSAMGCKQRPDFEMFVKALERIKHRSETQNGDYSKSSLRKMAITVLNKMKKDYLEDVKNTIVYFPIIDDNSYGEVMKAANECVYCENEEFITISLGHDVALIHPDVPIATAKALGVPNVRRRVLSKSEYFEKWGQEESLAVQINNIIKHGYEDGFAVIKELFQNAEDAGASCFYILYDERENRDACRTLIGEHMSECQGPAFWVFNDAEFSDQDFFNIKKLGVGTKRDNPEKIGKFGHGFCAVYNITDVPSILTGSNLIIFDPQTTYLDTTLPQGVPGVRINLANDTDLDPISTFCDQFKPYENVFGCNLKEQRTFPGTLFRLPLRTKSSQISDNIYTNSAALNLMDTVKEFSSNLFLFNNSIHTIRMFHLEKYKSDPSNKKLVFQAKAEKRDFLDTSQSASMVKEVLVYRRRTDVAQTKGLNLLQEVDINTKVYGNAGNCSDSSTKWIVSWAYKTSEALVKMISTNQALLPVGSVALPVDNIEGSHSVPDAMIYTPCSLKELLPHFYQSGHYYGIIPTPHYHHFMFHINGQFQLSLDRKHVKTKTDESLECKDTKWNELLICYPIVSALLFLFEQIKINQIEAFQIWPKEDYGTDALSKCLVESFYKSFSNGTERQIFEYFGKKVSLSQCIFLDPDLRDDESVGKIAFDHLIQHSHKCVIDIPRDIYSLLYKLNTDIVKEITVFTESFLLDYFLDYLEFLKMSHQERNCLLRFAVYYNTKNVQQYLRVNKCIPADDGGLKIPSQIVDPKSKYARLFLGAEGFFPETEFLNQEDGLLENLRKLGIQNNELSQETILNRANSIIDDKTPCSECIIDRALYLMKYLCEHTDIPDALFKNLKTMSFLPVMTKPEDWPFPWHADSAATENKVRYFTGNPCENHESARQIVLLGSPSMLYSSKFSDLVSIHLLIFEKSFCDRLQERSSSKDIDSCFSKLGILGVTDKEQHVEKVVSQLTAITELYDEASKHKEITVVMEHVLKNVYSYLEDFSNDADLEGLKDKPIIWVKDSFISAKKVSSDNGINGCQPYLYNVQESAISRYPKLWTSLEIVEHFYASDIVKNLENIAKDNLYFVCESQVDAWVKLLYLLKNRLEEEHQESIEAFLSNMGNASSVYIPDENGVIRKCSDLCLNDDVEIEKTSTMKYVHKRIPLALAKSFGVKGKKIQRLEDSCEDIEFFQEEALCTRLRRLVDGFSTDSSLFKEILQNADDAKASEVIFVKDYTSYSTDTAFDESFNPLQGPALCVYNDGCFSHEDLQGIKQIGLGSKSSDPLKIGKFGIGFNAVYYITDAPSFYSEGPEIENGETLCIFDPLASFIPNVTRDKPGKRYKDLEWIRKNHTDVLKGYHEEILKGGRGTMFRFPLRIEPSEIKRETIDMSDLSRLLDDFCKDLKHSLIFLRHVKNVRVRSYENGKYQDNYIIETVMTSEDVHERKQMASVLNSMRTAFDNQRSNVLRMDQQTFKYSIIFRETLCDRCISSSYKVIQTVGFDSVLEIPKVVEEEYMKGSITLLPEGGIAFQKQTCNDIFEGKLFCLVPLPVSTGIPAHVNGHFLLDYGTRMSLYKSENEGSCYKSQWNIAIIEHIIVKSYVEYLRNLHYSTFGNNFPDCYMPEEYIQSTLDQFFSHFPIYVNANNFYWKLLTKKIYAQILADNLPFLPLLEKRVDNGYEECSVSWIPISSSHCYTIDVYDSETDLQYCKLVTILRRIGIRIADIPQNIRDSFEKSDIVFETLCPKLVIDFLCSVDEKEADESYTGTFANQPIHLTRFETCDNLQHVMRYCLKENEKLFERAMSLPIFITQDCVLRKLSKSNKLFVTEFTDFFQERLHQFVHKSLFCDLHTKLVLENEEDIAEVSNDLLANFTIEDFVTFTSSDGLFGKLEGTGQSRHGVDQETEMIENFWLFFRRQLTNDKRDTVKENLGKMKELKLLPVMDPISGKKRFITPAESSTLIDLDSFQEGTKLHELIKRFFISELDKSIFKSNENE